MIHRFPPLEKADTWIPLVFRYGLAQELYAMCWPLTVGCRISGFCCHLQVGFQRTLAELHAHVCFVGNTSQLSIWLPMWDALLGKDSTVAECVNWTWNSCRHSSWVNSLSMRPWWFLTVSMPQTETRIYSILIPALLVITFECLFKFYFPFLQLAVDIKRWVVRRLYIIS